MSATSGGPDREPMDGEVMLQRLVLIGQCLPDVEDLIAYVRACDREEAIGPVLFPSAYMRAEKRLPAVKALAQAAIRYARAFAELQAAAAEEADPEADSAAQALYRADLRRMGR